MRIREVKKIVQKITMGIALFFKISERRSIG